MEREDFLALLDLMKMEEAYAPPPIDQQKLATAFVRVLSTNQTGNSAHTH
jgi:hypothetical protein